MAADLAATSATQTDQHDTPKPRTISFAAGLAPLVVQQQAAGREFRTAAAIAATPLAGGAGCVVTDVHSSSILVLKPRWCEQEAAAAAARSQAPRGGTRKPQQQQQQGRVRGSAIPEPQGRGGAPPPPVLRFESWRFEGRRRVRLDLEFHVATAELGVRSSDGFEATVVVHAAAGPRSGAPLEPWDLHVGATLRVLGRQITLCKAEPRTRAWLDGEAALLSTHRGRLLEELSKFVPIPRDCGGGGGGGGGVAARSGGAAGGPPRAAGGWAAGGKGPDSVAAAAARGGGGSGGGAVSLRKLRHEVAALAGRLRQFKAHVPLPPELQNLVGEGPASWRIDGASPQRGRAGGPSWRGGGGWDGGGGGGGAGGIFEVGETPTWVGQLAEWKHKQRQMQLSGLAASAAAAAVAAAAPGGGGGAE